MRLPAYRGIALAYAMAAIGVLLMLSLAAVSFFFPLLRNNDAVARGTVTTRLVRQAAYALAAESGDSDADGAMEAPAFKTSSSGPTGGGALPASTKAPTTDGWSKALGYCAWDNGTTNSSTSRLVGDNPGSDSSVVFALVSAGPDRQFATTCANIKAGTVNGDDIVQAYTVAQLRQGLPHDAYQGVPVANGTTLSAVNTSGMLTGQMRVQDDTSVLMSWTGSSWSEVITNGGAGGITLYNRLKNYFINGDQVVAQRGTSWSITLSASGTRTLKITDHWRVTGTTDNGVGLDDGAFQWDSASNYEDWPASIDFLEVDADLYALSANTYVALEQAVEGVTRLAGKTLTLSLDGKDTNGSDTIQVWVTQNFGTGGSPSAPISQKVGTISLTSGWTRPSSTFTMPAIPSGTVFGTNGDDYTLVSLRDYKGHYLYYSRLQLEDGSQATAYEYLNYGLELAMCQRYFQKGDTSATSTENYATYYATYYAPVTGSLTRQVRFRVPMRAAPNVTIAANTGGAVSVSNATPGGFTATQSIGATGVFTSAIGKADADW